MHRVLLDLVTPPRCGICGDPCRRDLPICGSCCGALAALEPVAGGVPGLDGVWSAGPYEGVARRIVGALKFGRRLNLARLAAETIAGSAPDGLLEGAVVPVPASPLRSRWRGYDAAEAIASVLASRKDLPFRPCLRRSNGRRQVGRSRAARLADPPSVSVAGEAPARVALVDDVVTTGATLGACAEALRRAGSDWVVAVTLASSRGHVNSLAPGWPRA